MKKRIAALLACLLAASCAFGALADDMLAWDTGSIPVIDYGADSQLTDKYGTYYVGNCFDHNASTTWAEGVSGHGIGSFIWGEWRVNRGTWLLKGVAIWGGYHKSDDVYYKNNRPCEVEVGIYCDGMSETISARLYDSRTCQLIYFDEPQVFYNRAEVSLTIDSVYMGSKYSDTCVTDIDLIVEPY